MEEDKDTITFTISDDSTDMSEVGHLIIHENPASPVDSNEATASESNDDISDNDSNDMPEVGEATSDSNEHMSDYESSTSTDSSAYKAATIIDSPTSTSSTLQLNSFQDSTDRSEVGDASSESNEEPSDDNSVKNFDEANTLYRHRDSQCSHGSYHEG